MNVRRYRFHIRRTHLYCRHPRALPAALNDREDQFAGLVAERPEGRNVFDRAEPKGLAPLVDWMSHYGVFWRERFANLRTLLKEIDP